jgi:hypothetical protein
METVSKVTVDEPKQDMTTLTPKQMADRLTLNHYIISIGGGVKADNKRLHLIHGDNAKKAARLTVQEIIAVYGVDEWEVISYWEMVKDEIDLLKNYPYVLEVTTQNK